MVLKHGGLLLLRTPNALFYRICQRFLAVRRALGYNNLFAFPYLYGYQSQTLVEIAETHGFRCAGKLEWSALDPLKTSGQLTGPWIEVFCRAV